MRIIDLEHPRNSESDHRDVLRLSCKKCKVQPYWQKLDISDLIEITKYNQERIRKELCKQFNREPNVYSWDYDVLKIIKGE